MDLTKRRSLCSARDIAEEIGVTTRSVWKWRNRGLMPSAFKLGRLTKWHTKEVVQWINSGCPVSQNQEPLSTKRPTPDGSQSGPKYAPKHVNRRTYSIPEVAPERKSNDD